LAKLFTKPWQEADMCTWNKLTPFKTETKKGKIVTITHYSSSSNGSGPFRLKTDTGSTFLPENLDQNNDDVKFYMN
jgi:hypothetical protein